MASSLWLFWLIRVPMSCSAVSKSFWVLRDGMTQELDDDEEDGEEDGEDEDDEGSDSSDEYADDEGEDGEGGGGGGGKKRTKASKAGGAKPKAQRKSKKKAGAGGGGGDGRKGKSEEGEGGGKKAKIQRRDGVPFGGKGFRCPSGGCGDVFDSAEDALEHDTEKHGGSGEREVDEEGCSPCLWCQWDGSACGKKFKVVLPAHRCFKSLRRHEADHEKGRPQGGFVCPGCQENHGKDVDAAWRCAETHGIPHDPKRCLWEGCSQTTFRAPADYRTHEPVRHPHHHSHAAWPQSTFPATSHAA